MTMREKFDLTPIESNHFSLNDKIAIWAFVGCVLVAIQFILWSLP